MQVEVLVAWAGRPGGGGHAARYVDSVAENAAAERCLIVCTSVLQGMCLYFKFGDDVYMLPFLSYRLNPPLVLLFLTLSLSCSRAFT